MGSRVKQTAFLPVPFYPTPSSEDEGGFASGCEGLATCRAFLAPAQVLSKPSLGLTVNLWTLFPASAPGDIQRQQMEPETWRKMTPVQRAKATVLNIEERA